MTLTALISICDPEDRLPLALAGSTPVAPKAIPVAGVKPGATFRIFNAMLYSGMPTIGERLPVVYDSSFYGDGKAREDGTPTSAGIASAVVSVSRQAGPPWFATTKLVAVDIERWKVWPFTEGAAHERSVRRYADVAERFSQAVKRPICLYGIAPEAGINQAAQAESDTVMRRRWQSASDVTRRWLVPQVQALCPPLYSYYGADDPVRRRQHLNHWKAFARQTFAEANRIAPGKPVYPFVWPQYHNGGSMSGHHFVPDEVWREQLRTVRKYADGLILWGGWNFVTNKQLQWQPDAAWLKVLNEEFPELKRRDE